MYFSFFFRVRSGEMQFLRLIQHAFYQYCPRSFPISDPSFSFHLFSSHYSIQCHRNRCLLAKSLPTTFACCIKTKLFIAYSKSLLQYSTALAKIISLRHAKLYSFDHASSCHTRYCFAAKKTLSVPAGGFRMSSCV